MILVLVSVFGVISYFLARLLDGTVADINETRHEIDELTRYAVDKETRVKELNAVQNYSEVIGESLPEADDIIEILDQLENMASIAGPTLSIGLEEGIIGEGGIEFEDETEKKAFLKNLDVKEYESPESTSQDTQQTEQPTNVVLQLMEESTSEEKDEFTINYLEIDLALEGTYDQIRAYISLLQELKYFFNIKEVRFMKTDEGKLSGMLRVRAFIFEK